MQGRSLFRAATFALALAVGAALSPTTPPPTAAADTTPTNEATPRTVSAAVQKSPQMNGVAWTSKIHDQTAYIGGAFTQARPFGAALGEQETPRTNLLAFNVTTGELTDFAPTFNGEVRTIKVSYDGKLLFVGGNFTQVDNQPRARFAAFDIATGQLTSFAPRFDYYVYDITDRDGVVYFGGRFTGVNDVPRSNVAAARYNPQNPSEYELLPWAPRVNSDVRGIELDPTGTNVVIGGNFQNVGGHPARGWARLDAHTGAVKPWPANELIQPGDSDSAIYSLQSTTNGVYATAYSFGGVSPFEGVVFANWEGKIEWVKGCKGDTYDTAIMDGVVYSVGHTHNCEPLGGITDHDPWHYQRAEAVTELAAPRAVNHGLEYDGMPAPELLHWYPKLDPGDITKQWQAAWTVDADNGYVVLAGEFVTVNDSKSQGIALFAYSDKGPATQGPVPFPPDATWDVQSTGPGQVTASVTSTYDYDNSRLRYELLRGDTVVAQTTRDGGAFWNVAPLTLVDPFAPNGDYEYSVRVTDADGNTTQSKALPFSVTNAPDLTDLNGLMVADGARSVWSFSEARGRVASSVGERNPMMFGTTTAFAVQGATNSASDTGIELSGGDYVPGATTVATWLPPEYTAELWFKTDTTQGGMLMNFGTSRIGTSRLRDRVLYMTSEGRIAAGILGDVPTTVLSQRSYNDNQWHHAATSYADGTLSLHIDGEPIGSRDGLPPAQQFAGYWKVGGDPLGDWPNTPASWRFRGIVDEVAVYDRALGADRIAQHWYSSQQDQ